ncbi:MAG: hypothetical protein JSU02_03395, partial [Bacteroidetes bacterium]|nr:hypothetical protein [Bacteroidota bacterium]
DEAKVREVFEELEFKTLLKTVLGGEAEAAPAPVRLKVTPKQQPDLFSGHGGEGGEALRPSTSSGRSGQGDEGASAPLSAVVMGDLSTVPHDYRVAATAEEQEALAKELAGLEKFCFDTETDALDLQQAELVGLSFSWKAHTGWYVPVPAGRAAAQQVLERFR